MLRKNPVAVILYLAGVLQLIGGIIGAFILPFPGIVLAGGFISGLLFIGFGENLKILHTQNELTYKLHKDLSDILFSIKENKK
ncbi:hypothetical protein [Pseudalkalibacillus caeni]|uniref:Uncharacterized protein n=1 Tax=Exobacillus caeni TaxID=2574798 RepID=A0A5R9F4N4_9BACL|nr:hypothetical protein [Pseudalkalibacillus caeni]TLS37991.1 hypothetical protein FCL54_05440 [Pseudalkalibacillus caeni]